MAEQSVDELQKQLTEYREQLEIVDAALKENPDNSEFLEVKSNLLDVLEVTEDLLKLKKETSEVDANYQEQFRENQKIAQRRGLFVGKEMQARYSADGKFYKAKKKGFGVTFLEYGTTDIVSADNLQEKAAKEVIMVNTATPGAAAVAKSTDQFVVDETGKVIIPQFMKILPTDSEKVRAMKKRKIKNYKSEYRLQQSEQKLKRKKSSWQDFQDKGRKHKRDKQSIFASPETIDGRVGVVGSGKEMTKFQVQKYTPKSIDAHLPQTRIQGSNPWGRDDRR